VALADPRRGVHPPAPGRRGSTGGRSPQPPTTPPGAGRRRPAPCGTTNSRRWSAACTRRTTAHTAYGRCMPPAGIGSVATTRGSAKSAWRG